MYCRRIDEEMRSFSPLDVASRLCNEAKGRYANIWRRSSGGQSSNLAMMAFAEESESSAGGITRYDRGES